MCESDKDSPFDADSDEDLGESMPSVQKGQIGQDAKEQAASCNFEDRLLMIREFG